jgi:hypothetical protein
MISNEEHARVVELVYAHDYYLHLFNDVRRRYAARNMKTNTPHFWNDFWIELPDTAAIRRAPFFDICNLAEQIYEYDNEIDTDM